MNLKNVGNLRRDYVLKSETAKSQGFIIHPQLVLKLYSMAENLHPGSGIIWEIKEILKDKICIGEITPLIGMGFAILSKDMLNVARWDIDYPIVFKNQIYGFENGLNSLKLLDIRDIGALCIWEGSIFTHEKEAWKKYLQSQHTELDKSRYLNNFIEGDL